MTQQQTENPPGTDPPKGAAGVVDEESLGKLIETRATDLFNKLIKANPPAGDPPKGDPPATPPAAAPAGGPSMAEQINTAVQNALKGRDQEDQLALLHEEISKLKTSSQRPEVKRNWASWFLGMGSGRV